jgi:hypothetical protein
VIHLQSNLYQRFHTRGSLGESYTVISDRCVHLDLIIGALWLDGNLPKYFQILRFGAGEKEGRVARVGGLIFSPHAIFLWVVQRETCM